MGNPAKSSENKSRLCRTLRLRAGRIAARLRDGEVWKPLLWAFVGALGALACLLILTAAFFADHFIFHPAAPRPLERHKEMLLDVAPGVSISVLYLRNPKARYTLLYSHGNSAQLQDFEDTFEEYVRHGFSVIAYDYEGYGNSGGSPSEKALFRDAERVYRYLTEEQKVEPGRIIFYGRSVGSGPSCYLAAKYPGAALILEAPFTSAFSVVGLGFLPFDRFRNIDRIGRADMPLLILHGSRDRLIAQELGRKLFAKAKRPQEFVSVDGAGHRNIYRLMGDDYYGRIAAFSASLRMPFSVSEHLARAQFSELRTSGDASFQRPRPAHSRGVR